MLSEHHSYTPQELSVLRETSITEVLRDLGQNPQHTVSGMYFSPFHAERTPSFHVDERKHKWYDHGQRDPSIQPGGDVIDLVMILRGCSFREACDYLKDFNPNLAIAHDDIIGESSVYHGSCTRVIDKVYDRIWMDRLAEYGTATRHIPSGILNRYCRQVAFHKVYENGMESRQTSAIGFRNIDGNWALRWPCDNPRYGKVSTGQNYTAITPEGRFVEAEELQGVSMRRFSDAVVVFEGFMDFLSWLAWNSSETPRKADVVVLNTCCNDRKALDFIRAHDKVICYLDNDEAGSTHTLFIQDEIQKYSTEDHPIAFLDGRSAYADSNDVNEAWVKVHTRRMVEQLQRKTGERAQGEGVSESSGPRIR